MTSALIMDLKMLPKGRRVRVTVKFCWGRWEMNALGGGENGGLGREMGNGKWVSGGEMGELGGKWGTGNESREGKWKKGREGNGNGKWVSGGDKVSLVEENGDWVHQEEESTVLFDGEERG